MQSRDCAPCRAGDHQLHNLEFGGICIGCPCAWRPSPVAQEPKPDSTQERRGCACPPHADRVACMDLRYHGYSPGPNAAKSQHERDECECICHGDAEEEDESRDEESIKSATFAPETLPPEVRAKMDADRRIAELEAESAALKAAGAADRAVMVHLVKLLQDSPDVRYFVGGHGSQMRELLCAAIAASGFKGDPEEALQPSAHHRDDEALHVRLRRRIDELEGR